MFGIYKTQNNKLESLTHVENGCWLNLINPMNEEIDFVSERLLLEKEDILSVLDAEETSRITIEEHYTLVIIDLPIISIKNDKKMYKTLPLAIFSTKHLLLTVCLQNNDIFECFINNNQKSFDTNNHTKCILQFLSKITSLYIEYLRQIDKQSDLMEEKLYQTTKDRDLVSLLYLEKSLIYFSTSLNSNEIVLDKLRRLDSLLEDEHELLEDISIENKQAIEMTKTYGAILRGMMDYFSSLISNKLNTTMKTLTSITLILYIPTLIASIFGMNIPLPLKNHPEALLVIISISFFISVIGAIIMKRKDLL